MIGSFCAGLSYLGFTDREIVQPYANHQFGEAVLSWCGADTVLIDKIVELLYLLGSDPLPKLLQQLHGKLVL